MSRCCSDPGVETLLHQLVVVLPVPGVPRRRVALAAWHTPGEGGDGGEYQVPARGHRGPPGPVPRRVSWPRRRRAAGPVAGHRAGAAADHRLVSPGFDAWSEALARVGNCSKPIRLHGGSQTVDAATGEILSTYSSRFEPLGVTHVRCGNRRATECPSCSRLYAADTFHLIRAGVARREDRPRDGGGEPAGVRHRHRTVVRAGCTVSVTVSAVATRPCVGRNGVGTASLGPARQSTARTIHCWGSRCAASATTPPPT